MYGVQRESINDKIDKNTIENEGTDSSGESGAGSEEFLGILCSLCLAALFAVLPLYTRGDYYRLGDTKYLLFRNVTLICLGIGLAAWLFSGGFRKDRGKYSPVDWCMICYGIAVILSAVFSPFPEAAWTGYRDWYMGALSQLLFVGIYFLAARQYDFRTFPLYLGEAALFAVSALGILNRLGIDPIGMFQGFAKTDWEYSHMLSTVGNINWLCGYAGIMLPLPLVGYWYSRKPLKRALLYGVSLSAFVLLCVQGSESGPLLAAVALGICLTAGRKQPERFRKALFLLLGVCVSLPVLCLLFDRCGSWEATPADGSAAAILRFGGWWFAAALCGVLLLLHHFLKGKARRFLVHSILAFGILGAVVIAGYLVLAWRDISPESWGSGRGTLWKMAWEGFWEAAPARKLIGAGPDCFAAYLLSVGVTPTLPAGGHWEGAIYANAHNEWLTSLVNLGVLGTAAYLGIFVTALKRYRGMLLGVLAVSLYIVHSFISFQQVMSAPYLFALLGLCEARCRRVSKLGNCETPCSK